jgi:hypothetical protein
MSIQRIYHEIGGSDLFTLRFVVIASSAVL